jgi:hypothetical protein
LDTALPERTWHNLPLPDLNGRDLNFNVHCSRILIREGVAWRVAVFRESQGIRTPQELHP